MGTPRCDQLSEAHIESRQFIGWWREITPARTPLRRKLGSRHTKRARKQAPNTFSRRRDGQEEYPGTSSTRGMVSYGAVPREEPGKPHEAQEPATQAYCHVPNLAWSRPCTTERRRTEASLALFTAVRRTPLKRGGVVSKLKCVTELDRKMNPGRHSRQIPTEVTEWNVSRGIPTWGPRSECPLKGGTWTQSKQRRAHSILVHGGLT